MFLEVSQTKKVELLGFRNLQEKIEKSFSEAPILASTSPQYDKRLFIDLPVQNMKTTSSEHVVYTNCSECQNKICGLIDSRIRASVHICFLNKKVFCGKLFKSWNFKSKFSCSHLNQKPKKNIFLISALASKKSLSQKTLLYNYVK